MIGQSHPSVHLVPCGLVKPPLLSLLWPRKWTRTWRAPAKSTIHRLVPVTSGWPSTHIDLIGFKRNRLGKKESSNKTCEYRQGFEEARIHYEAGDVVEGAVEAAVNQSEVVAT